MNGEKERAGVRSNRYDTSKSEVMLHVLGLSAELAFSKITGLQPNFEVTLHGDAGYDFITKDGLTIELKCRTKRDTDFALVQPTLAGMKPDIGVLMWPGQKENSYEFVGWTTRVHAAQKGVVRKLIENRYLVRWQDLIPPERFMELL